MKYLIFLINSIVAAVLLILFGLSFVSPTKVPLVPSITLLTPVFITINVIFFLYWAIKLSKRSLLSLISLLICYPFFFSFFQLNVENNKASGEVKNKLKILDYNCYGLRGLDTRRDFKEELIGLINKEQPDVLFFQEAALSNFKGVLSEYKYKEATVTNNRPQGANPVFSKYPIVNKGYIGMDNVHIGRNALYVDIKVNKDTIRCYNAHLTSYRYTKDMGELQNVGPKNIIKRANIVFKYQEQQMLKIVEHLKTSPYPVIFCGDFNNMAFSYVYRKIKNAGNLKDTFNEAGSGFGATIYFPYFPTRIDYVLVDESLKVDNHKIIKTKDWSDHYPIIAEIKLPKE